MHERIVGFSLLFFLLFAGSATARADEAGGTDAAKALVAELVALKKNADVGGLQTALKKVIEVHNAIEDKALRGKLQKEVGSTLKAKKLAEAHADAVAALAGLNDPKGAYGQLKGRMPGPKDEAADEVGLAVIAAVGSLAPESALGDLGALGEKAKDLKACAAAITALGGYGKSKKRAAVLEQLIKLLMRHQPPRGTQAGKETLARWEAVGAPLIGALNTLTGQKLKGPDEWMQLYKEHKKKPAEIFVGE